MPSIFDALEKIKKRPTLYLRAQDLDELHIFLGGAYLAMAEFDVRDESGVRNFLSEFGSYLAKRFGWSMSAGPLDAIQQEFGDRAWDVCFDLVADFRATLGQG
jgi:hypothetical protein